MSIALVAVIAVFAFATGGLSVLVWRHEIAPRREIARVRDQARDRALQDAIEAVRDARNGTAAVLRIEDIAARSAAEARQ